MSAVEKKRLFIGGLNSGTTEQDIRERFKSFGSIEAVELHKVQKKEGFQEKTFAYINIESSVNNIKRCISMLSSTKWRGGVLKIELAKESFLSRLKKEREQQASEKFQVTSNHSTSRPSLPKELKDPIKNAVPGTLIAGQKNWVVGKFGCALPVVHMRTKHGKKVMKFDPSKTVHNLKRFKEDEEQSAQVNELTWKLEPHRKYPWDNNRNRGLAQLGSEGSDGNEDGISDEETLQRKSTKKSKKSTNVNKKMDVVHQSESESDSDNSTQGTARKKSKTANNKRSSNQNIDIDSFSAESENDENHQMKMVKSKTKAGECKRSQKQDQSDSSSNSSSHESSDDERKVHEIPKRKNTKTEKHDKKDTSGIDSCGDKNSLTKIIADAVKQSLKQSDEKAKKKHRNTGIENCNSQEMSNLKPKKRKCTVDEERCFSESSNSDKNGSDSSSQDGKTENTAESNLKKKSKDTLTVSKEDGFGDISSKSGDSSNGNSAVIKQKKKSKNTLIVNEEDDRDNFKSKGEQGSNISVTKQEKKSKTTLTVSKENNLDNITSKAKDSFNINSSVTKQKKKRKSTINEETVLRNSSTNDQDKVENSNSEDIENVEDLQPKQKKQKESKAKNKDSFESESDVKLQPVLLEDNSNKTKRKEKKQQRCEDLNGSPAIQNDFENNDLDKAMNNSKRIEKSLVEKQVNNDDESSPKHLTKKKKKQKLSEEKEEETEKLSKESLKEGHTKVKAKGSKNHESNDEVESIDSNDDNNNKHNKSNQKQHNESLTKKSMTSETTCKQTKNTTLKKDKNKQFKTSLVSSEISTKKLTSNKKRLKAIKEKEVNTSSMQSIVSAALQNIDQTDKTTNARHITFDDNDDEGHDEDDNDEKDDDGGDYGHDEERKEKQGKFDIKDQAAGKISGAKASNWLGLDSDSDEDLPTFNAKPQFEGKTGQKLFQLQKSYRGDSRFQLDKRFAESDDEDGAETIAVSKQNDNDEDDGDDNSGDDDGDNVSKQLSQEKDMAMSVLRGILGKNIGTNYDRSSRKHKFKDSNSLRYDPTRDDHTQFEQTPKEDSSPEPTVTDSQPTSEDAMPTSGTPEVDSNKYYDVNTNALTEMFSKKNKEDEPTSFTFLSTQDDDDDNNQTEVQWGQAEILKSKPVIPVMLPYDSSGDEQDDGNDDDDDDDDDINDELQQTGKQSLPNERFFFHFGDPELENKVYEHENVFMRTDTLDQLNHHWVNTRSELTQDYKKKHKDAVRRQSKMAAKRARTR